MKIIIGHHDGRQETLDVKWYLVDLQSMTLPELLAEMRRDKDAAKDTK